MEPRPIAGTPFCKNENGDVPRIRAGPGKQAGAGVWKFYEGADAYSIWLLLII